VPNIEILPPKKGFLIADRRTFPFFLIRGDIFAQSVKLVVLKPGKPNLESPSEQHGYDEERQNSPPCYFDCGFHVWAQRKKFSHVGPVDRESELGALPAVAAATC